MLRDGRRPEGSASTTRHSAIIASPKNSKANASTAISPPTDRYNCRARVEGVLSDVVKAGTARAMVDARLRIAVNGRAYRGDAPIGDGIVSLQPLSPGRQLHPLLSDQVRFSRN